MDVGEDDIYSEEKPELVLRLMPNTYLPGFYLKVNLYLIFNGYTMYNKDELSLRYA